MTTDKIRVYSNGDGIEKAMDEAERFAEYHRLNKENALCLRLLTEEMMGLIRGITGSFEGDFWMEHEDGEYRLRLRADTYMDKEKKKELLSISGSRKNEIKPGFFGLLREMVENTVLKSGEEDAYEDDMPVIVSGTGIRGLDGVDNLDFEWSLYRYRVHAEKSKMPKEEAWDELEKSIVVKLADDIRVGVHGDIAELAVIKRF